MKPKLNAVSALIVVLLYLVVSIVAGVLALILFGGSTSSTDRLIDGVIDSGMAANLLVMVGLLFVSFWVFKASRRDIFFERKPFALSKGYYLFPLTWLGVALFAFSQVDFSAYSASTILLVLVAALAIGVNEEIVTRGILLVGLRNSGVAEWIAWLITVAVFSLLHLVNLLGGGNLTILLVTLTGGTLLYVARRVFGNLFVPIGLHALYDTAFFLLTGQYLVSETLPDHILDIQFGSFLVLLVATILFLIFGRGLLKNDTTGWAKNQS
jgi:membrane protease YdiL (CAAX protease family)